MSFWSVVGAVMMAIIIKNAVNALCKSLSKWIDKRIAKKQLDEIHALADSIIRQNKQNSTK